MPLAFRALCLLPTLAAAACADESSNPRIPHGVFLIADTDAVQPSEDPEAPEFRGAIFSFDPATKVTKLVAAPPQFRDPQDLALLPDGSLLVVDYAAQLNTSGDARGAVFRIDLANGQVEAQYDSPDFRAPTALLVLSPDRVLVADRAARPDPATGVRGAVIDLDIDRLGVGEHSYYRESVEFRAPSCLARDSRGRVMMLDADAKGDADPKSEGALFEIDLAGRPSRRVATLRGTISPLGLLALPNDDFLVFDSNADPKGIGGPLGAIFRLRAITEKSADGSEYTTELVASLPRFRDPVRGCLGGDGRVWFVDANADPEKRGPDRAGRGQNITGPGAILALDLKSGEIETIASPADFVNPVSIIWCP